MSVVDTTTGEVFLPLDADEARAIVARIRQTGEVLWTQIIKAYRGQAWVALSYESWDDLCEQEFDGARIKLPREQRREVVASLTDAGMSTRAIAAATGADRKTIRRDLAERQVGEMGPPADPDDDIVDAEIVEEPTNVIGLDGKTYTRQTKPATDTKEGDMADRITQVKALACLGLSAAQIAEDIGSTADYVSHVAKQHGVVLKGSAMDKAKRWERAARMASEGFTSRQIAEDLGVGDGYIRAEARRRGIDIPADAVVGRSRRLDAKRIVEETVSTIEALATGLGLIEGDIPSIDAQQRQEWSEALAEPLSAINRFKKELIK